MNRSNIDVQHLRKNLWWILLLFMGMAVFSGWMTVDFFVPLFADLLREAPSVRLAPMGFLGPFVGGFCVTAIILAILRAIPYEARVTKWVESVFFILVAMACIFAMLVALLSAPLQNNYLPKLGYTKCALLDGNPAMWFTDWVKNPDWCVRGKDRAWVHEQAGAAPPK